MNIVDLLDRSGFSDRELGRRVREEWRQRDPKAKPPKAESIGVFVGKLRKPEPDNAWWTKNKTASESLANLLGCDPAVITARRDPSAEVPFADLPELPPLRPHDDDAAGVGGGGEWLADCAKRCLVRGTPHWVLALPGAGKRLTVRHLKARRAELAVIEGRTLLDVARSEQLHTSKDAIVSIRERAPTDAQALAELSGRATATVVLAPFPPPQVDARTAWTVTPWQPTEGWRTRLVEWFVRRLGDAARVDTHSCLDILEAVDPDGNLLAMPGDVLPWLAWAQRTGGAEPVVIEEQAMALVQERLARSGSSRALTQQALEVLPDVMAAAMDGEVGGHPPRTRDEWAALVPPGRAPRGSTTVEGAIDALAAATKDKRQGKRVALERLLARDLRAELVDALIEADLLAEEGEGLELQPRWVRRAMERTAILRDVRTDNWQRVGRWASHGGVRPRVLGSIRRCERGEIVGLARELLGAEDKSLAWAAGVEVLFEVAAERLTPELAEITSEETWPRPTPKDMVVLRALGAAQARLTGIGMRARGSTEPTRLTASPRHWTAANADWLTRAWGFSLAVERPDTLPVDAGWAFPGWLENVPTDTWLPSIPDRKEVDADTWRVFVRLAQIGRRAVTARPAIVTVDSPPVVQAAAIVEGVPLPAGKWGPRMKDSLAVLVAEIVETVSDEAARSAIASRIWRELEREEKHDPVGALGGARVLRPFLVAALSPSDFLEGMDVTTVLAWLVFPPGRLSWLPDRLLEALFERIADDLVGVPFEHRISLPEAIGRLRSVAVLQRLGDARHETGGHAAARLWTIAPEVAMSELERRLPTDPDGAAHLINRAPPASVPEVIERALPHLPKLAIFIPRWLAERVAAGDVDAPVVFEALMGLQGAPAGAGG